MSKRVKYLHYMLNLNENDLLRKVFEAQKRNPVKGDWVLKVQEDLRMLGLSNDFENIKSFKKTTFKKMIKSEIIKLALNYLNNIKSEHSKMTNLNYDKLEIQSYLTSTNIYPQLAKQIFKWKTRMMNFKMNFKNGSTELFCPLGCPEPDSQDRILHCSVVRSHLPKLESTSIKYEDIFSKNNAKLKETVEVLNLAFIKREKLLEMRKLLRSLNIFM